MDAADIKLERLRRLIDARYKAGFRSARAAAIFNGWPESSYRAHEKGGRNFGLEDAIKYGEAFNVNGEWIWNVEEISRRSPSSSFLLPNATPRRDITTSPTRRISVLGSAAGGALGEFTMNGQVVDTVPCPSNLEGVPGAYAVYAVGDSMEPRYNAGEVVFVHPHKPYRKNDYVVVQINVDGEDAPHGFIKQYISLSPTTLILRQFNPPKEIEFPRKKVISIHRIVGSSET